MRALILFALSTILMASSDFSQFVENKLKMENPRLYHQYQAEYLADTSNSLGERIEELAMLEHDDPNGTWLEF